MMKHLTSLATLVLSACARAHAGGLGLDEIGIPFTAKKVEIVWNMATNRLPAMMNVYKVVPARFSPEVISNVVALGEFAEPGKVRNALAPASEGKDCLFEEVPAHNAISISPHRGRIFYFNDKVIASWGQPVTGLPSENEVLELSLELAKRLGIKVSEFARKPDSDAFLCWRDRRTQGGNIDGKLTKRETARGISLRRAIGGVSFQGVGLCGGIYVNFGNNGKIAQLDFSWRNLELKRSYPVLSRDEIAKRIKSGKAAIQIEDADPAKIRKLTITSVMPHYRGQTSAEVQTSVYPFAAIEATADLGDKTLPVTLLYPIIKE